jgi:hypothetical protein
MYGFSVLIEPIATYCQPVRPITTTPYSQSLIITARNDLLTIRAESDRPYSMFMTLEGLTDLVAMKIP